MDTTPSSSTPFAISTSNSTGRILYSDNYVLPRSTTTYTFPQHAVFNPAEFETITIGSATSTNTDIKFQLVINPQEIHQYSKEQHYLIKFINNYFPFFPFDFFALSALVYIAVDKLIIKRFK